MVDSLKMSLKIPASVKKLNYIIFIEILKSTIEIVPNQHVDEMYLYDDCDGQK